jgi:cell division protein FtsW
MSQDPMRRARILSFWNPERDASATGYQLWNGFLALGAGGWYGVGFMESRMKARYLPEAHTDFILSIVGEELGLIAIVLVMIAYGVFCWAGIRISINANTRLGMLLGFGLTIYITLQALINVAVISGSMPTKGMPAPFISYGGSNLLTCMTAVGLLLSIALETVSPDYNKHILAYLRRKWPFGSADGINRE